MWPVLFETIHRNPPPPEEYGGQDMEAELLCRTLNATHLMDYHDELSLSDSTHWMTTPLGFTGDGLIARDIGLMPHLLIAGATGMGKSMMLSSILGWLHIRGASTDSVILIDSKSVDFYHYEDSPMIHRHVTSTREACEILQNLAVAMDRRFSKIRALGARDARGAGLAPWFVIIDEWADLVLQNKKLEIPLIRIAQKGRAAGMHLILATQRPSRDVVTGLIKANFPARICFGVTSRINSYIVLDDTGAETLGRPGESIYMHGIEKVRFKSIMWSDEAIMCAVKLYKARVKRISAKVRPTGRAWW